ncbi:MAG: metallophosphoesterase [Calditrichaeota bacterium]|nr:metallophosphoesterase [Calditrichota bacterium]
MKIAHLSDLHINSDHRPLNISYTEKLIEQAIQESVDHIIITGDLTHNASDRDFDTLRQIFEKYDLLHSEKLSLVIGNHDIYGGVHLAEDILTFPERCLSTDYHQQVMKFHYYFQEAFDNIIQPFPHLLYPFAKFAGNCVFVGINSIAQYSRVKNLFASKGKIDQRQREGVRKILKNENVFDKIKIFLIHHHFTKYYENKFKNNPTFLQNIEGRSMKLRQRKKIIKFLHQNSVDLVLHGHLHESSEYIKQGVRFVNAGGTIDGNRPGELKLNLISIIKDMIETRIKTVSSSHTYPNTPFITGEPAYKELYD